MTADKQATPRMDTPSVAERITAYLSGGGLFNPELANHDAVRDLLIDTRVELAALRAANELPCCDAKNEAMPGGCYRAVHAENELMRLRASIEAAELPEEPEVATPEYTQRIVFEGAECAVMSPEDYASLWEYAKNLRTKLAAVTVERDERSALLEQF